MPTVPDAIILSDLHLGAAVCQASTIAEFLESIHDGLTPTKRLILNGDVFDSIDFRRLNKKHWNVLSLLRKLSNDIDVVWVCGNHDGSAEIVSHLLGLRVVEQVIFQSGSNDVLVLHGHQFDKFIERYPVTTRVADWVYRRLQQLDRSHSFAKMAKRNSKMFLRSTELIRAGALRTAEELGCDIVCCGHTHLPIEDRSGPIQYFNSGCWTEKPCHYLEAIDGNVYLRAYVDPSAETVTDLPAVRSNGFRQPAFAGA